MRLLFDQNLSHKLVHRLADVFPGSQHVRDVGMKAAADPEIANYALSENLTIVSKDADFLALRLVLSGEHLRMVWIRLGNGSTDQVESALRARRIAIEALADDPSQVIEVL
jgi:predicted nuclease of predicted toxin-antitoxin system